MNRTSRTVDECVGRLMCGQNCNLSLSNCHNCTRFSCTDNVEKISEPWIYIVIASVLSITTILSFVTNGTVMYVLFVKKRCFLTRINTYIATVCILAIVTSLFGCPMVISSSFVGHWLFSDVGCTYYGFLMTFCGLASMYMLTIIALDRYLMVVCGVFNSSEVNMFSHLTTSGALVLSLALSVPPLVGWNRYTFEGFGTSCSPDIADDSMESRVYLMTLLVAAFVIPIFVMTFCYWNIFAKILVIRKNLFPGNSNTDTPYSLKRKRFTALETRVALTMLSILGAFMLCWTPYVAILIWSVFKTDDIPILVSAIPTMLTKTGSCLTPLVYLGRDRKMRKVAKDVIPCLKSKPRKVVIYQREFLPKSTSQATTLTTKTGSKSGSNKEIKTIRLHKSKRNIIEITIAESSM